MVHPTVKKSQETEAHQGYGPPQPGFFEQGYSNEWNPPSFGAFGNSQTDDDGRSRHSSVRSESAAAAGSTTPSTTSSSSSSGNTPSTDTVSTSPSSTNSSRVGKVYKNKDEKLARDSGIGFSIHQIVGLPMDEFNDLLSRHELTEEQLNLCRDIRRRGKNKVAAQNCRKRKIDQVEELQKRIQESRQTGMYLKERESSHLKDYNKVSDEMNQVINEILRKNNCDPATHTLKMNMSGSYEIVRVGPNGEQPPGSLRPSENILSDLQQQDQHPHHPPHPPPHHQAFEPFCPVPPRGFFY